MPATRNHGRLDALASEGGNTFAVKNSQWHETLCCSDGMSELAVNDDKPIMPLQFDGCVLWPNRGHIGWLHAGGGGGAERARRERPAAVRARDDARVPDIAREPMSCGCGGGAARNPLPAA